MKRVFIIHGWGGCPEEGWFPWLKKELEKRGFKVLIPQMPNAENPKIENWVPFLGKLVGKADEETFFVGHSIGCQAIMRYFETLPKNVKVGGVVFVAGWFNLIGLGGEEKLIAKPWIETPISLAKVILHMKKFVAIFSDNDPFVPFSDSEIFREKLGAKIIVEKEKEHFSGEDGINELPSALKAVLELSK